MKIIESLRLLEAKEVMDLNEPVANTLHSRIPHEKKSLRNLYIDFYRELKNPI